MSPKLNSVNIPDTKNAVTFNHHKSAHKSVELLAQHRFTILQNVVINFSSASLFSAVPIHLQTSMLGGRSSSCPINLFTPASNKARACSLASFYILRKVKVSLKNVFLRQKFRWSNEQATSVCPSLLNIYLASD